MILDLHRHGADLSAIVRRTGLDRKAVRNVIADGLEPPIYGSRPRRTTQLQPFEPYLRDRLAAVPEPPAP
jgi:transposase